MSENRSSDSEIEEPEGFWPDEPWPDHEPFEVVPYTPDTPELMPPDEHLVQGPADELSSYNGPEVIEEQANDAAAEFDKRRDPAVVDFDEPTANPRTATEHSWQASIDTEQIPAYETSAEPPANAPPVPDERSYAYHITEEPVAPDQPADPVETISWNDGSPNANEQAAATVPEANPPDPWELRPEPPVDPFADDPFAPTAAEEYWVGQPAYSDPNAPVHYIPETPEESIRRSGLAWSAGIAFFGSVAFMLFLGWLADLLLGTAPWGMVGGIVLGSIIGFIQFFRISSQIYGTGKQSSEFRPLLDATDREMVDETPDPPATPPLV